MQEIVGYISKNGTNIGLVMLDGIGNNATFILFENDGKCIEITNEVIFSKITNWSGEWNLQEAAGKLKEILDWQYMVLGDHDMHQEKSNEKTK